LLVIDASKCDIDLNSLFHSSGSAPPSEPQNVPTLSNKMESVPNITPSDALGDLSQQFVPYRSSRHDEFDWALTKKVLITSNENTVISTFLVKLLLSILAEAAGTGTSTHRELLSVLPSVQTFTEARDLYGKAFGSLLQNNPDYKLNLGAKLYLDKFITPQQRFQAIIKSSYYSDVESVDFSKPEETAAIINEWCSNSTKNHITNIVNPDDISHAVILLLNTIYFNGYWVQPFPENQTANLPFYTDAKTAITAPFMQLTGDFYYMESDELDARILRLPYKGYKFSKYIVLPNKKDGLAKLLTNLDSSTLHRAQYVLQQEEIKVALPKFKFTNTIQLNEILKTLGIRSMFTFQASLPALARGQAVQDRLQVSNVLQKTGIEVNEKGSTAYAATQISLTNKFGGETEFIVDRPFMFMIEDETTGTLVFSGKVTHPEY